MADPKAVLVELFGALVLKDAQVTQVQRPAAGYAALALDCPSLRGSRWTPGDKIQILLSGEGMRTYTPFDLDPARGTFQLLAYAHGKGPGARWVERVQAGQTVRFHGLSGSLSLASKQPRVVFGDETSLGLAAAVSGSGTLAQAVLEVDDPQAARAAAQASALTNVTWVQRREGDVHLEEVMETVARSLGPAHDARLVLSGKASSIQALRRLLKQRGVRAHQQVKAYWASGKTGLD